MSADDLVTRLRATRRSPHSDCVITLCEEAAREVERLRDALDLARQAIIAHGVSISASTSSVDWADDT